MLPEACGALITFTASVRPGLTAELTSLGMGDKGFSIGVSLSGGGHRATLFSLGALLAIVDLDRQGDVHWINSVSGGSITNAYVAANCEYSNVGPEEFYRICQEALTRVSRYGSITGGRLGRVRVTAFMASLLCSIGGIAYFAYRGGMVGWFLAAAFYLCGLFIWRLRGYVVELGFRDAWCKSPTTGAVVHLGGNPRTVEHIFSAADIRNSAPVFFSDSYVADGSSIFRMGNLPIARAVRASAAFPGLLPPVRMRLDRLVDHGAADELAGRPPRTKRAYLVDGGVYNNLGTEWPIRAGSYSHNTDHLLMKDEHHQPVAIHLVIDSSAPAKASIGMLHEIPIIGSIYTISRTFKTTYESTLDSARRDISPGRDIRLIEPVERPGRLIGLTERPGWGRLVPDRLRIGADNWRFAAWTTRATKTTLFRIKQRHAVRILAHGYALTLMTLAKYEEYDHIGDAWDKWLGAAVLASFSHVKSDKEKEKLRRRVVSRRPE